MAIAMATPCRSVWAYLNSTLRYKQLLGACNWFEYKYVIYRRGMNQFRILLLVNSKYNGVYYTDHVGYTALCNAPAVWRSHHVFD